MVKNTIVRRLDEERARRLDEARAHLDEERARRLEEARARRKDTQQRRLKKKTAYSDLGKKIRELEEKVQETRDTLRLFEPDEKDAGVLPDATATFFHSLLKEGLLKQVRVPGLGVPKTLNEEWFRQEEEKRDIIYTLIFKYAGQGQKLNKEEVIFLLSNVEILPEHDYTIQFLHAIINILRKVYILQLSHFIQCREDATPDIFKPLPLFISFEELRQKYFEISEMTEAMTSILTYRENNTVVPEHASPIIRSQMARLNKYKQEMEFLFYDGDDTPVEIVIVDEHKTSCADEGEKLHSLTRDPTCSSWNTLLF